MGKKTEINWENMVKDIGEIPIKYTDGHCAMIAIKYQIKPASASVYIGATKKAQNGGYLKGNYNADFIQSLKDAGFTFNVRTHKSQINLNHGDQTQMRLGDYDENAKDAEIKSLKATVKQIQSEMYQLQSEYNLLIKSLEVLVSINTKK